MLVGNYGDPLHDSIDGKNDLHDRKYPKRYTKKGNPYPQTVSSKFTSKGLPSLYIRMVKF